MANIQQIRHNLKDYSSPRLLVALVILLALSIAAASIELYAVSGFSKLKQNQQFVDRVGGSYNNLITGLRDADASIRTYVAMPDTESRETFTRIKAELPKELSKLDTLTAGTDIQVGSDRLRALIGEKLADLQAVVDARDNAGAEAGSTVLRDTQAKRLVDQVRGLIITIEASQSEQIRAEQEAITNRIDFARMATLVLFSLTMATIVIVLLVFVRAIAAEKELERAKDDFLSLASHQLRTPASGVKSVLSMIVAKEFGELTDRQEYFLRRAADSNQSMLDLVEDMLNVARFESGKFSLNRTHFTLQDAVQATIFEQRKTIENRQQQLVLNLPDQPILIDGDESKVRMVIGNILENASKYTKERGRITVSVTQKLQTASISINDNGVGIAKKDLANIFSRFGRASNELSEEVGGTGLGLYLAKIIVELHNGGINVTSHKGRGTTFTIALPQIGGSHAT